ncbi:MAG: hypothetical protein IKL82_01565 [Clostridia bacterium]|nr:hypothetical protein [Clostridia bacterium]
MKKITAFIFFIVAVLVMVIAPFLTNTKTQTKENGAILSVWQIDSFEGGSGSRTSFLRKVLLNYTKQNPTVSVLVSSHTPSSATSLIEKGVLPDVISYGPCSVELSLLAKKLPFAGSGGGEINGELYAVPFLRGGYFVIQRGGGSSEVIISCGEYSMAPVATLFSGVKAKSYITLQNQEAYSLFLKKTSATMVGTQRDIIRLNGRGIDYTATPISEFSDVYQYLSVTSINNAVHAEKLVGYLLSDKVQSKVTEINMLSVSISGLYKGEENYSLLEKVKIKYTPSAFSTKSHLETCNQTALNLLNSGGDKGDIIKYLKQL